MYLEFVGEVNWEKGTLFSITFNIMLISHKDYIVGDIYWFAAAMQYNHERADWVSDIAFELGPLPVVSLNETFQKAWASRAIAKRSR